MLSIVEAKPYDLLEDLTSDVYKAFDLLEEDKESQYLRRSAVKAVFSFIECIPYILKYKLRKDIASDRYKYELNQKEEDLLYEYEDYKISLLDNFKKTFKLTKKVWGLNDLDLKTHTKEYQTLKNSISIRDRITHPKKHRDIIVRDKDIYNILISFEYIRSCFSDILKPHSSGI